MSEAAPHTCVVSVINFHGLTLPVIEADGREYLYAKPLSDLARIDWRSAKKTLQETENAVLYGSQWLNHPVFAAEGGTSTPTREGLYIRLDRARMYLARINTKMMKGKGSIEAAEALLQLQIEWAEALHLYETTGEARKDVVRDRRRRDNRELREMIKTRDSTQSPEERKALTAMVQDMLRGLGYPVQTEADV